MRKLYDSGALLILGFLVGLVLTLLRRRAEKREQLSYHAVEPASERSYAYYYPTRDRIIPKDHWKEQRPDVLAALWAVNEIRSEELPPLAADLLEAGHDGKYLRRLAGEISAGTRADVAELAEKVFAEFGVPEPMSVAAANQLLARYFAEKVLNDQLEPSKATVEIARLYDWDHLGPAKEFVMLNYAYEELYERKTSVHDEVLDEQTRAACVSFIEANPPQKETSLNPSG